MTQCTIYTLERWLYKLTDFVIMIKHIFRDGPFDIQGGWDFLKNIVCFPTEAKKNQIVFNEVKNKKVCSSFSEFFKPLSMGAIKVCK